jgi:hypothetical protein
MKKLRLLPPLPQECVLLIVAAPHPQRAANPLRGNGVSVQKIDKKAWHNAAALPAGSASTSVQGFDYDHDAHGRREVVRPHQPGSSVPAAEQPPGWRYGYHARGEVEQADRFRPEADTVEAGIVPHQRRAYDFDLMGNRESATQGAEAADQAETGYTPNLKQQYETITHSRRVEITGQAIAGATVELTLDGGTPFTVDRAGCPKRLQTLGVFRAPGGANRV